VPEDAKFHSPLVTRLINTVMRWGQRSVAQRIVYGALDTIGGKQAGVEPLEVLQRAVDNAKPRLEVKSRRVGGATYQVPVEVEINRSLSVGVRWMIKYASERGGRTMADKLAAEILDAVVNKGGAVKKREDTHKMAEANRAFAHYRW
jgi:small subunit ribosomal protein S7